jgi:hypothetical protein
MAVIEGVGEYLKRISTLKTKKQKIDELRKPVEHFEIRKTIVDLCYNKKYIWLLPDYPTPEIKKNDKNTDLQAMLISSMRKVRTFLAQNGYDNVSRSRREQLWLQFLESLDADDVDLMESVRFKKMPYKSLTKKLFEEAYPDLEQKWR